METNIVGVGVGISDRFRAVVEEKTARIATIATKKSLDVKVTHRSYRGGHVEDETVELTHRKGPLVRAEARRDKFTALDLAVDKLIEQVRRARTHRRPHHPRGARFEKGTGELRASTSAGSPSDACTPSRRGDPDHRGRGGVLPGRHPHEELRCGG
jgi:ribosomal subunit interface protein